MKPAIDIKTKIFSSSFFIAKIEKEKEMREVMELTSFNFKKMKNCDKEFQLSLFRKELPRNIVLADFFKEFARIIRQVSKGYSLTQEMVEKIGIQSASSFQRTVENYEKSWFSNESCMVERKRLDYVLYNRFWGYMKDFLVGCCAADCNVVVRVLYPEMIHNEEVVLKENVHLIVEKQNAYYALSFFGGKSEKGMCGKSEKTMIQYELNFAVMKEGLESQYPGITIVPIYFGSGEEKGIIKPWDCSEKGKASANVFFISDSNLNAAASVLHSMEIGNCQNCSVKYACKMQRYSGRKQEKTMEKKWQMPSYDASQQSVIHHKEGIALVCAGPGSGKTATVIGRVIELGKTVPTEQMLCISYSERAANELKERISSYVDEEDMPRVCTIHALGMEIIQAYDELHPYDHPHVLLTNSEKKNIVRRLLEEQESPLKGISYKNFLDGAYSTVNVVCNKITKYQENPANFYNSKDCGLDKNEWEALMRSYREEIEDVNFITYDDQLTLSCAYLKNNPIIRNYFSMKYKYVIVDEYQDVNGKSEALIHELGSLNGNLMCIGDSNQSIYSFTGSSSRFIDEFPLRYPNSVTYLMKGNYRSTKKIADISNLALGGSENLPLDEKAIVYTDGMIEGAPVKEMTNELKNVCTFIQSQIDAGVALKDIAIIATRHKLLQYLFRELPFETVLAENYGIHDFMFALIYQVLSILYEPQNTQAYLFLALLFEKDMSYIASLKNGLNGNMLTMDPQLSSVLSFAKEIKNETAEHFVAQFCAYMDMDDTVSEEFLLKLVKQSNLHSTSDLFHMMNDMVFFEDDTKIHYLPENKITLITAHSSKGCEFHSVLVYDADSYQDCFAENDGSSYDRKLLFVALSRAKRVLAVAKSPGTETVLEKFQKQKSA